MAPRNPCDTVCIGQRASKRRRAFLEAATALFMEKGYEKTTLSEIVERSGGSRATLYELFGDKEGLFQAMMRENGSRIWETLASLEADELGPPATALTVLALRLVDVFTRAEVLATLRVLVAEGDRIPQVVDDFLRSGPETLRARLAAYLERVSRAGLLPVGDPDSAARAFVGLIHGSSVLPLLVRPTDPRTAADRDRYVRGAVQVFLGGIGAAWTDPEPTAGV